MKKSYEQYCPLARALDVVGDRWALLVLRELFFSPKRFTDLQARLPGIATNLLSRRLRELEGAGLVRRRKPNPPASIVLYELTDTARGLETAILELAKWGIQFLGVYRGDQAFNLDWLLPVMEEMADRDAARGIHEAYEFRIGDSMFWVDVADGEVAVRAGRAPGPADLLVETDVETFMGIGFGTVVPEDAVASGRARVIGEPAKAERALDILAPSRILSRVAASSSH